MNEMNFTVSNDDEHELLQGMRDAAKELILLGSQKDSLQAIITAARYEKPKPGVQKSAEGCDYLAEVAAEILDIETDIKRLGQILEADRQRVRRIMQFLEKESLEIIRLYYLFPVKDAAGNLRTWREIEELAHLSHTGAMKRRRKLFKDVNKIIEKTEKKG